MLVVGLFVGCATNHREQISGTDWKLTANGQLISTANVVPYSTCQLQIYTIGAGDTLTKIAHQFNVRLADLRALNPELAPGRLKVGMKILVAAEKIN